ncbi:anti-sigma factor [Luteimonas vadosa]|uniref:Anti-sigma factor n=1 Tax=Luteimonas vadosa TaxID=1165507 RepID=A0ABP9E8V1_9GAMM
MNTTHEEIPDNDDLLAAEYVLGLLDPGMRRDAAARLQHDVAFKALVADWESRFSPWLAEIAPVAVPSAAWPRIRSALGWHGHGRSATPPASAAAPSLWERISFWRGMALGGVAVAAASVAALAISLRTAPEPIDPSPSAPMARIPVSSPGPAAPMAVSLVADDGSATYNAVMNPDTGVIVLVPVNVPEDARVPELWLIGDDGVPKSLGVIARDRAQQVRIPDSVRKAAEADAVFAISLEPEGGSPTGAPTGPVVAKGNLIKL